MRMINKYELTFLMVLTMSIINIQECFCKPIYFVRFADIGLGMYSNAKLQETSIVRSDLMNLGIIEKNTRLGLGLNFLKIISEERDNSNLILTNEGTSIFSASLFFMPYYKVFKHSILVLTIGIDHGANISGEIINEQYIRWEMFLNKFSNTGLIITCGHINSKATTFSSNIDTDCFAVGIENNSYFNLIEK